MTGRKDSQRKNRMAIYTMKNIRATVWTPELKSMFTTIPKEADESASLILVDNIKCVSDESGTWMYIVKNGKTTSFVNVPFTCTSIKDVQ
jgi:hypothetical protein